MVLNSQRLRATSTRLFHLRAAVVLLATACVFVAPRLMAQTAIGNSGAATRRSATQRPATPRDLKTQWHEAGKSSSGSQPDTQALLAEQQAAVASADAERIELTSTRLIAS